MPSLKKMLLVFAVTLFIFPGNGIAFQTPPSYLEPERFHQQSLSNNQAEILKGTVQSLAEELYVNLEDPDPLGGELSDGLLVCTFVDINKLNRTSTFGRYVAGQLMNEFQRFAYMVTDMRKSVSVMVQEKRGEFGLSRDPDEIRSSHQAGAMLTGTYMVGENEIIVTAQILDNKSATLLSGATVIFPRTRMVDMMLKDSASARKRPSEVVYMKQLEL